MGLIGLNATDAIKAVRGRANDVRPRVATGFPTFDRWLHRGGFAPGELVILAGRTGTRKTTVALNMVRHLLSEDVRVGFVTLDESVPKYVAKLASVMFDKPIDWLEENVEEWQEEYRRRAAHLTLSKGYRPTVEELSEWKAMAELDGPPLQVVFLDYVSLLERDRFAGAEVQRISRLIEELQVWTNENDLVLIALHQVGRFDEGSGGRYHGEGPLSLEGLKYGGEEIADVVMATYRPALDPLGRMTLEDAFDFLPDGWKPEKVEEAWSRAHERVQKYRDSTFLQLLKNRPGEQPGPEAWRGVELVSPSRSMVMVERGARVAEDMKNLDVRPEEDDWVPSLEAVAGR